MQFFVYNIARSTILDPDGSSYLLQSGIPLKIRLSEIPGSGKEIDPSDFKVTANIRFPDGTTRKDIKLLDDGEGIDEGKSDGIFSHLFELADKTGNYEVEFFIEHLPTAASSVKKINFEIIDLSLEIALLAPESSPYLLESGIPIRIGFTEEEGSGKKVNPQDFKVTSNIKFPDGTLMKDIELLDDGEGIDEGKSDGIYSHLFTQADQTGDYEIEFFIQHLPTMANPANPGRSINFTVTAVPPMEIGFDNNLIVGTKSLVTTNFSDFSEGAFSFTLNKPGGEETGDLLYDNGEAEYGDAEKGDGIYSILLEGLDSLGSYIIEITGIYTTADGEEFTQVREISFNKSFKVTVVPESINIGPETTLLEVDLSVISIHDENIEARLNDTWTDNVSLEAMTMENDKYIIASNSEKELKISLQLKEGLEPGNHQVIIPLILDDIYKKDIKIELAYDPSILQLYFWYILIAGIILAGVIIFLLVYFLKIKPGRRA